MPRYLDPKNDYAFKRVFGAHKNLCLSLLNGLLPIPPDNPVVELEYLSNELMPESPMKKFSIVDVRCTDKSKRQFLVEMQWHWTVDFETRVLFNTAKVFSGQLARGDTYSSPQPVYALNLLNDIFEKDVPEYYHHYKISHTKYPDKQMRGMEFVFVELPKFVPVNRAERKLRDIWLRFLKEIHLGMETVSEDILAIPEVREALRYLEAGALTDAERAAYDAESMRIWHERAALKGAEEIGEKKGEARGRAEGRAEERAKAGQELAAERAKAEAALKLEKLAIARDLLATGMEPVFISRITKLSLDEIQKLSQDQ